MKQYRNLFIILTVALFLTACGGGGGTSLSELGGGNGSPGSANPGGGSDSGGSDSGGSDSGGSDSGGSDSGGSDSGGGDVNVIDPSASDLEKASQAQMATEAVQIRVQQDTIIQSGIGDFLSKTTLSSAEGVSSGIATGAHAGLTDIQREINAIEGHRKTAEDAYNKLKSEAKRLEMEATKLEMQLNTARNAEVDLNTEANNFEDQVGPDRLRLDIEEAKIAAAEEVIVTQEELAEVDDAEADRLAGLNPAEPMITALRMQAEAHRMEIASQRAIIAAIKSDPSYITLKRETEAAEAIATAKRAEATAKGMEVTQLQTDFDAAQMKARETDEDADKAKAHLDAIVDIKDDLEEELMMLKGVVGADAAATESEKAQLVFDMLKAELKPVIEDSPLSVRTHAIDGSPLDPHQVIELNELYDSENHVFARADKPAGTMTFEEIANDNNDAWVLQPRSFTTSGTTVDTAAHRPVDYRAGSNVGGTGLPQNHLAISLTGLNASDFVKQDGTSPADGERLASQLFHHGKLNGIEGTLYCDRAGGCRATTLQSNVVFGEGWYFTPVVNSNRYSSLGYNTGQARYMYSDEDGIYELVSYVDYGMWLDGPDDDALVLNRRANLVGPSAAPSALDFATVGSATYTGEARGLSARKVGTVYASGHFEADVELVATFGGSPILEGTIDNFRAVAGSGHVDGTWSLRLAGVPDGNNKVESRISSGGAGKWSATPYGATRGQRPDGFFGGFSATFDNDEGVNGAAVGVYSVE